MTDADPQPNEAQGGGGFGNPAAEQAASTRRYSIFNPRRVTEGAPFYPLLVLFLFNSVDELDQVAFNVLLPNIRDHFRLTGAGTLGLVALTTPFALVFGLAVGYFGDRFPRTPVARGGAMAWGGFSFLTGLAPSLGTLAVARAGAGMGKVVNNPMHQSLIADYYEPRVRPKVFAFYNAANHGGRIVGPLLAGVLAAMFSWRAPFLVFAFMTGAVVLFSLRLREPVRGRHDRRAAGADEAVAEMEAKPPTFGESWRLLYTVATVRRLYFSIPLLGASFLAIPAVLSLYYERVFNLNEVQRGLVFTLDEPFSILGLIVGAPIATRLMERDPSLGLKFLRYLALGVALFIFLVAVAPNVHTAVVASMGRAATSALLTPTIAATLSLVMPPRARALGFSVFGIWFLPSLFVLPLIGSIGDTWGFRVAILILIPMYLAGIMTLSTAAASVTTDIENNRRWSMLESEAQLERIRFRHAVERGEIDESTFALLDVRDIKFSYGPVQVLFDLNLQVARGGRVALLGTNGAGKSTLLRIISGLEQPDIGTGGSVWFRNEDVTMLRAEDRVERGIVLVPGGKGVFTDMTVAENLEMQMLTLRKNRAYAKERRELVMETFPRLAERLDQRAASLSGGEQQQLALAKAVLLKPELLCVDELSLGLAPVVVQELLEIVEAIHRSGVTVVVVEQSLNIACQLCDWAVFLEKGEVRFEGPSKDLLERDDIARAVFLGGAVR